ncbi:MAG: glycoside hydrolase family 2 TIM barrel-domain containing protein [Bacteroidota bacterium]
MKKTRFIALLFLLNLPQILWAQSASSPHMLTPWSEKVEKPIPLNQYPRPNMVRANWQNLNGSWDYAITPKLMTKPTQWNGKIRVPFPVESYLSGVEKRVGADSTLWYKRSFAIVGNLAKKRVLLHFGGVDWQSTIFLNGKEIYTHRGGYTAFSVDITPNLKAGIQELLVQVWDPSDEGKQARGKQVKKPGGIYYTPATGIWQTVWYEVVPETYVESYRVSTNIDQSTVSFQPTLKEANSQDKVAIKVLLGTKVVATKVQANGGKAITIKVPNAQLWSPNSPTLYTIQLSLVRNNQVIDKVNGYFGMRKIEIAKDEKGTNRLYLNHKPVFQYGPLDQGYWPDGVYTAPTEEALLFDIQKMKEMGFNMVRKHAKVEPERWYYHCDRLGLLVWQDMPSGFGEIVPVKDHDHSIEGDWLAKNYQDVSRDPESEKDFRDEMMGMIEQLYNFPSICVWVPFNESWGQFKTNEMLQWTKSLDSTRLVDGPSGWVDRNGGDMHDYHLYGSRLKKLPLEDKRALVIGEFGGLGYAVKGHTYSKEVWSYQGYKNSEELGAAYEKLMSEILDLKQYGYAAAVYTQLTDVETEINGLITYDRQVIKVPAEQLKKIHAQFYKKLAIPEPTH